MFLRSSQGRGEHKGELEQLKRMILGRRSERHIESGSSQLSLFDEPAVEVAEAAVAEAVTEEITYRRKVRSKADRFPENLPREVRVIDVPQAQRLCPCCGEEMPGNRHRRPRAAGVRAG